MSSDAEMTPVKRKGGASSKADSKKSRKQKEPSPEEVDEQDEEEYEIEEVLDCRLGMFAPVCLDAFDFFPLVFSSLLRTRIFALVDC